MIKGLIFDFDGTIAKLYVNYNRNMFREDLKQAMANHNVDFVFDKDSFFVFEAIAKQLTDPNQIIEAYKAADKIMSKHELAACDSAVEVNGCKEVMRLFDKLGYKLAVVSNNCPEVAEKYLQHHHFDLVVPCFGRIGDKPELLKPDTYLLKTAIDKLTLKVEECIYIGDSIKDFYTAEKLGCRFIAMATTEEKQQLFAGKAEVSVKDYFELLDYLKQQV